MIAAVLLASSLDQALQVQSAAVLRADAVRQLETAGKGIGAEIKAPRSGLNSSVRMALWSPLSRPARSCAASQTARGRRRDRRRQTLSLSHTPDMMTVYLPARSVTQGHNRTRIDWSLRHDRLCRMITWSLVRKSRWRTAA